MQATQSAVTVNEYRNIPVTALVESPTNPRKRFGQTALEELAASFKTQGILAPLLVRELEESKYEVVARARRLRAAKLAELKNLPVRVVKLTDAARSGKAPRRPVACFSREVRFVRHPPNQCPINPSAKSDNCREVSEYSVAKGKTAAP